ncbi:MAG: hypothetical protein NW220_21960 [Leptolyngbyaceae cyanobacterium bins.349]|nr:hypothetical protein [Leptolyngbyaceae cyanobacterium bins.349]
MTNCLKIGDRLLTGDDMITALVQYQLLNTLIGHILLDEAIQAIAVSPAEILQRIAGTAQPDIPENFEAFLAQWCEQQGITPAYFKSVMLREWRIEKFKQHYFADQLESEFSRTKTTFDQVDYSVIQLDDPTLAEEIYYQLRDDGVAFADLASAYSVGYERETGGRVGPVPLASLPVALITRFQSEPVGIVQPPLAVGDRIWIVRLEQLTRARFTEATRLDLTNRLFQHWLQSRVEALTALPGAIAVQPHDTSA